jgi:hypothetical protein
MGRWPLDQGRAGLRPARGVLPAIALPLLLGACGGGVPRDIDPRIAFGNLFGAHLEGRQPPPGLDQPYPNLASVPARPVPPDRGTRGAISGGLAEDRESSRAVVTPGGARTFEPGAGPPAPPRLLAAPAVRQDPGATRGPAPAAAPAQTLPQLTAPPAAPAPELLAPAPSGDLAAPPPPPAGDLLAPRGR